MGFLQEFSPQVSHKPRAKPAPRPVPRQTQPTRAQGPAKQRGFVSDFGRSAPTETYQPVYSEPIFDEPSEPAEKADRWTPAAAGEETPFPAPSLGGSSFSGFLKATSRASKSRSTRSSRPRTRATTIRPSKPSTERSASGLERRLDELSARTREASGQIRSAENRRDSLKQQYSQKLDQLRAAKDELSVLKQRESQSEESLSRQSKLIRRLERKLSAAMGWGQDYYSSSSSFDFEMSDLELNYQDGKLTTDSRWRLSEFLDTKKSRQSQTASSLNQTRDSIRNCEARISRLSSELEQVSSEQEQASRRSESTQRKKATLEQELQRLQDRHFEVAGTFY